MLSQIRSLEDSNQGFGFITLFDESETDLAVCKATSFDALLIWLITVEESEDSVTSGSQQVSPNGGPTLPILQKIIDLSSKIKVPPFF